MRLEVSLADIVEFFLLSTGIIITWIRHERQAKDRAAAREASDLARELAAIKRHDELSLNLSHNYDLMRGLVAQRTGQEIDFTRLNNVTDDLQVKTKDLDDRVRYVEHKLGIGQLEGL